jgi:hypothetical protein
MSTEISTVTQDFISKRWAEVKEKRGKGSIACRNPKKWMLVARHAFEGSEMSVIDFSKAHDVSHWTYYAIKNDMQGAADYEEQRSIWALEAQADVDMLGAAVRQGTGIMLDKMADKKAVADTSLKETAQMVQQLERTRTMVVSNYQKLTGAATQHVIVEHKTTLGEAEEFARKALEGITEAVIVEED